MFSRNLRPINANIFNPVEQPAGSSINPPLSITPAVLAGLLGNLPVFTGTGVPTPAPSSNLPATLQSLLNMLQLVNDGDVIASDYFNLHTQILLAIASLLGTTTVPGGETTVNFSPAFLVNEPGPAWVLSNGVAQLPPITTAGAANGWLPIQLPDNARIQSMTVIGERSGNISPPGEYQITLVRQLFSDPTQFVPLITIDWSKDTGTNSASNSVQVPGAGEANEGFKPINNSLYKYYIIARVGGAPPNTVTNIQVIQLTYSWV